MRQSVYPRGCVPEYVERALAGWHPDVLLIWNPVYHKYQLYNAPQGRWDAQRLVEAIVNYHRHKDEPDQELVIKRWQWWLDKGAPVLVEDLPRPPGDWLVSYLNKVDLGRYPGGSRQWIRDFQDKQKKDSEKRKQVRAEFAQEGINAGFGRHARDFAREDPLAGKRRWVHSSPTSITSSGKVTDAKA